MREVYVTILTLNRKAPPRGHQMRKPRRRWHVRTHRRLLNLMIDRQVDAMMKRPPCGRWRL